MLHLIQRTRPVRVVCAIEFACGVDRAMRLVIAVCRASVAWPGQDLYSPHVVLSRVCVCDHLLDAVLANVTWEVKRESTD